MSYILQIETSTTVCSVALALNGEVLAFKEANAPNIHAAALTLFIQEVMQQVGIDFKALAAVAVSKGPGSYTGLRIGVSTAKGLCFALDIPLIAIETLAMMSASFMQAYPKFQGVLCPMIDARRMEVYNALYSTSLLALSATEASIIDALSFKDLLAEQPVAFFGDGAAKCSDTLTAPNAKFYFENFNSANFMSVAAYQAYIAKRFEDVAYFEPFYLKNFVATTPKKLF